MKTPLVSILIPVYNAELFLTECLESLIEQSYQNIEVLCVNDGSKDSSLELLHAFANTDTRIKVFDKENGGASSARNLALKHASGEFICMVDSDDYIDRDAIETLVSTITKTQADAVLFDLYYLHQDGRSTKFKQVPTASSVTGLEALNLSLDWTISGVGMFNRAVFIGVSYDESNLHGDELTTRVLFSKCQRVSFSTGKYFYRQHSSSSTSAFSTSRFGLLDNQLKIRSLLQELGCFELCKARYCAQLMVCIWSAGVVFSENKHLMSQIEIDEIRKRIAMCRDVMKNHFTFSSLKYHRPFYMFLLLSTFSAVTLRVAAFLFTTLKKISRR
ncbi:glycosyltransferase family 2 protein [Pseudoalteromonas tunicata]|uniref:Glycosyltransferase 2-like domain-containing protein n=1 Tax=Pseudoalteromonas tunicata D2 TaxID=87626 RepID=A4C8J4_9GAMM|nr:glycosyltransferase family 2 protein [Pseudoalteromonas tunicata]ATC93413.1 alpha-1,6-rhamnosyltransferase [Pseudoalteromonas tunicata]AXT32455.1 glycosyltransferase family 2 protein [Pseudoalteromonas tunicata]EAR28909.1 hypothetical protein PTD2_07694 [Pseudoalteromonas tunicata D2]